jgi:hypothetical protein
MPTRLADFKRRYALAERLHLADHLVPRNDGIADVRQFSLHPANWSASSRKAISSAAAKSARSASAAAC